MRSRQPSIRALLAVATTVSAGLAACADAPEPFGGRYWSRGGIAGGGGHEAVMLFADSNRVFFSDDSVRAGTYRVDGDTVTVDDTIDLRPLSGTTERLTLRFLRRGETLYALPRSSRFYLRREVFESGKRVLGRGPQEAPRVRADKD
jgi:hypothetical protein